MESGPTDHGWRAAHATSQIAENKNYVQKSTYKICT